MAQTQQNFSLYKAQIGYFHLMATLLPSSDVGNPGSVHPVLHQAGSGGAQRSLMDTVPIKAWTSATGHTIHNGNLVYFYVLELGLVKNKPVIVPNSS